MDKTWIQEMIEREATPKPARKETVDDFAARHGIDSSTYYYQARKKENKREIVNIWLNEATNGGHEILEKLREKAIGGDIKAIELYMKFVLELAENLDIKSDGKPIFQLAEVVANRYGINTSPNQSSTVQ